MGKGGGEREVEATPRSIHRYAILLLFFYDDTKKHREVEVARVFYLVFFERAFPTSKKIGLLNFKHASGS